MKSIGRSPAKAASNRRVIKEIQFADDRNSWILGENFVARTNDSGKNWTVKQFDSLELKDLQFSDANKGWLTGDQEQIFTVVYQTLDGGKTWKLLKKLSTSFQKQNPAFSSRPSQISRVRFVDDRLIWSVGNKPAGDGFNSTVWQSRDGGQNWETKYTSNKFGEASTNIAVQPSLLNVSLIEILSNRRILASFEGFAVLSKDDGQTWREVHRFATATDANYPQTDFFTVFEFINDRNGWAISDAGNVFYSPEGGEKWTKRRLNLPRENAYIFTDIKFINDRKGWLAGFTKNESNPSGVILTTSNGGETWAESHKENVSIIGLAKTSKYIFAVGNNGVILRCSTVL